MGEKKLVEGWKRARQEIEGALLGEIKSILLIVLFFSCCFLSQKRQGF